VIRRRLGRLLLALAGAAVAAACERSPSGPPNVLLVTFDALRQDHLSFSGYERPTSPNLDWLAARGTVRPNVVPTSCSTKASLTSLLTSLDYSSHRVIEHAGVLDAEFLTLAETFRAAGFATGAVVATPHLSRTLGYDQGFDEYEDLRGVAAEYVGADLVAARALELVGRAATGERPFFLYVHFEEPHPPWVHESPWVEHGTEARSFFGEGCGYVPRLREFRRLDARVRHDLVAKYDGAIRFADAQLGRLIDELRRRGELANSLVAVTTDHGLELLDRYSASHGFNPFDEVLRVPFVLYDGRHERGAADDRQARLFDVGPTLLAAAGVTPPAGIDGVDLNGPQPPPPAAFATCYGFEVVRTRQFKLFSFDHAAARRWYRRTPRPGGLRDGLHLFDLRSDPGERREVGELRPETRDRLRRELEGYRVRPRVLPGESRVLRDDERSAEEIERLRALGYIG
jgi:arylsulfatase A-like enzyme